MKARLGTCLAICLMAAALVSAVAQSELSLYLKVYETPTTKVRVGFVPYKAEVVTGEPLKVTFTVENIGSTNFEFWFGGDYRGTGRHDRFKIAVTNANGEALPDPIAHPMDFGGLMQQVNLKPGQFFTNVIDLTAFRVIDKPGTYTVSCSFAFDEQWGQKESTNPVVNSTFTLTILERTPERVAKVLDELVAKAQAIQGHDRDDILTLIVSFGKDDALPRLAKLAQNGPADLRAAAIGALSLIPTDASLDIVLAGLKDSDPAIRVAAAGSLGTMQKQRGVDALLEALPKEKSMVADAIVLALGTSKSARAFPVITNTLDAGEIELKMAAINALVNFGGSNAVAALMQRINTNYLPLRYDIVLALVEKLHQTMQTEWLIPVLIGREENHEWLDSIRLLRMYAGDQAIPSLLSYLDFDAVWSGRNWWILETGVKPCPNAPPCDYEHDSNSDGTPEQWQKNLKLLQTLKPLAAPLPKFSVPPAISPAPHLNTDPPIDFTPSFKKDANSTLEIKSGFLTLITSRGGFQTPFSVPESYRSLYQCSSHLRSLPNDAKRCKELNITPEQLNQLDDLLRQFALKLCNSRVINNKLGNFYQELVFVNNYNVPFDDDWFFLERNVYESPDGPMLEQAKADLMNSVQAFSQNYHAGTVEFVKAAKNVFTPAQFEQILK